MRFRRSLPSAAGHIGELAGGLDALGAELPRVEAWGERLFEVLTAGGRLLSCGNGGSAAEAQHLTSELVGRYRDDRPPFSAVSLCAETSSVTAIGNDYGADEVFARQVRAHGRPGDILVCLSTSGTSPNVLAAAAAATRCDMTTWALTGAAPNPLADACDDALCVPAPHTATVQEIHLVAVHLLCAELDRRLMAGGIMRTDAGVAE